MLAGNRNCGGGPYDQKISSKNLFPLPSPQRNHLPEFVFVYFLSFKSLGEHFDQALTGFVCFIRDLDCVMWRWLVSVFYSLLNGNSTRTGWVVEMERGCRMSI